MFHARLAPAVGHCLVDGIAGSGGPELLAVAGAEALDAVLVEQRLGGRHQRKGIGLSGRALVGGVEPPHGLDFVAEEVEADRIGLSGRKQVDDRAADGEVAGIVNGVAALVAVGGQQRRQHVALDPFTLRQPPRELAHPERGYQPLGGGIGRGDQQLRRRARDLQGMQRRHPFCHDPQRRRGAVVGQAVPGGEGEDLDLGREDRHRVGQRAHRRFVGGDDHGPCPLAMRRARQIAGQPGQEAGRHAAQRQRRTRLENPLQRLAHLGAFRKSSRRIAAIIGPSNRAGGSAVPIAQAMISTSCSSSRPANQRRACGPQAEWWASKNPPIIRSASRVPQCHARQCSAFSSSSIGGIAAM